MDFSPEMALPNIVDNGSRNSKVILFKQSTELVSAIDKLFISMQPSDSLAKGSGHIPDRKLDFHEVRKILVDQSMHKQLNNDSNDMTANRQIDEALEKKKEKIKKIESILKDINETAQKGNTPKLYLRNQTLWSNCIYDLDRVTLKSTALAKKTTVSYSNSDDRNRFNSIVFVLTKIHELLTKNLTVTRRELFYQNVVRFRNQSNLDVAVRDVCCLLETPPWELSINATAKGLVAGPLIIETSDGKTVDCSVSGGTLIPQDIMGIKNIRSTAKYILVVEKDAIFQKLLDEGSLLRLGPVIIITGKGYPDVCTRLLLVKLCKELQLRALALVDADPHGYDIFLTYKYGSLAQSHLSSCLACTSLLLLGTRFKDIVTLAPMPARLKLSERDRLKIKSMLKRPYLNTDQGKAIADELNSMLSSGMKSEIEAVAPTAAALCDAYLPSKIIQADFLGSNNISNSMDMFIDSGSMVTSHSRYGRKFDKNSSAISLNFSQCEMMRNVSRTDCLSEGAYSGNTCDSNITPADLTLKDEQLEKYFRSIDKWSQKFNKSPYHELRTNVPEE